jgi:hypothetical protein
MKQFTYLLICLITITSIFTRCKKDEQTTTKRNFNEVIIGTWKYYKTEISDTNTTNGNITTSTQATEVYWTFKSDGNLTGTSDGAPNVNGTYTATNNVLIINIDNSYTNNVYFYNESDFILQYNETNTHNGVIYKRGMKDYFKKQ